jgi:hypothetical protein
LHGSYEILGGRHSSQNIVKDGITRKIFRNKDLAGRGLGSGFGAQSDVLRCNWARCYCALLVVTVKVVRHKGCDFDVEKVLKLELGSVLADTPRIREGMGISRGRNKTSETPRPLRPPGDKDGVLRGRIKPGREGGWERVTHSNRKVLSVSLIFDCRAKRTRAGLLLSRAIAPAKHSRTMLAVWLSLPERPCDVARLMNRESTFVCFATSEVNFFAAYPARKGSEHMTPLTQ